MECKALICFSEKSIWLEERRILTYREHCKVQKDRLFLPDIFVSGRCFLLFLILSPRMKTLFRVKRFFWFWEILLNSSYRWKSAVWIYSDLDFGVSEVVNHLAEQSCDVKSPRDLDDVVLEALTLPFISFPFLW